MTATTSKGPRCERKVRRKYGGMMRCRGEGVHCYAVGEFGRLPKVLCLKCIGELRTLGWKITYQLEGDAAAPVTGLQEKL